VRARLRWIEGEFSNPAHLDAALEGQEIVFHLVSTTLPQSSNENPTFDFMSNVGGTIELLKAARRRGVKKIVFPSSGGTVYGMPSMVPIPETHPTEPRSSYGISKLAIEKYLALFHSEHGLEYAILRLANPYGRYQSPQSAQGAVAVFAWKALTGKAIEIWGNGEVVRDYIYVSDAVDAMVAAMNYEPGACLFNVGSGQGRTLIDVIRAIEKVIGREIAVTYMPPRSLDTPVNVLDISKIKRELGWHPKVSFEDGIRTTIDALSASRS
jgi:UDP-glucose 4-epimerase